MDTSSVILKTSLDLETNQI